MRFIDQFSEKYTIFFTFLHENAQNSTFFEVTVCTKISNVVQKMEKLHQRLPIQYIFLYLMGTFDTQDIIYNNNQGLLYHFPMKIKQTLIITLF